jgi:hypothetical protein
MATLYCQSPAGILNDANHFPVLELYARSVIVQAGNPVQIESHQVPSHTFVRWFP